MSLQPDSSPMAVRTAPSRDAAGRPILLEPAVAAPAVVASPAPVVQVVHTPAVYQAVAMSSGRRVAPDSVVVGLVGLALMVIGLITVTRAGVDGSMREPVVKVLGFTHTATLGVIEAAIGLCLLLCAATMTRGGSVFFGLLLGVGGFVGAVQTDSFKNSLALQSGLAWLAVLAGIIVVVVSVLVPRIVTRTERVEAI